MTPTTTVWTRFFNILYLSCFLLISVFFVFSGPCPVSAEQILTGAEILKKVDENLQPGNLEMYRKIINIEPDGKKRNLSCGF